MSMRRAVQVVVIAVVGVAIVIRDAVHWTVVVGRVIVPAVAVVAYLAIKQAVISLVVVNRKMLTANAKLFW